MAVRAFPDPRRAPSAVLRRLVARANRPALPALPPPPPIRQRGEPDAERDRACDARRRRVRSPRCELKPRKAGSRTGRQHARRSRAISRPSNSTGSTRCRTEGSAMRPPTTPPRPPTSTTEPRLFGVPDVPPGPPTPTPSRSSPPPPRKAACGFMRSRPKAWAHHPKSPGADTVSNAPSSDRLRHAEAIDAPRVDAVTFRQGLARVRFRRLDPTRSPIAGSAARSGRRCGRKYRDRLAARP